MRSSAHRGGDEDEGSKPSAWLAECDHQRIEVAMRMKVPSRRQRILLPPSIDEFVAPGHRVRVIVDVVEQLDLSAFEVGEASTGRSAFPPEVMVSLLLYAMSTGVFSAREMARRCETDCAFMYATAGLRPSYRTIARFRADNAEALSGVFTQVVMVCRRLGMGGPELVVQDGTRVRASASLDAHERRSRLVREQKKVEQQIQLWLEQAAQADAEESEPTDELREELRDADKRLSAIRRAIESLDTAGVEEANATDPDARLQRMKGGSRPGYNAQIMVSGEDGTILAADVTNEPGDTEQLLPLLDQLESNTGESAGTVVADAGYESGANAKALVERDQDGLFSSATERAANTRRRKTGRFQWTDFDYDPETDEYICPANRRLVWVAHKSSGTSLYRGVSCSDCLVRTKCVTGSRARTLNMNPTTPYLLAMAERREVDRSTTNLLVRRKAMVEGHFGHFKHNLRWRQFLVRGLIQCRAEFRLLCAAFNLTKLANKLQSI
jgi:transposase